MKWRDSVRSSTTVSKPNQTHTFLAHTHTQMEKKNCFFFSLSDLKPQLDDAQQRLEAAKAKQSDVMEELKKVQSSLNSTTSNLPRTHTHRNADSYQRMHTNSQRWVTGACPPCRRQPGGG